MFSSERNEKLFSNLESMRNMNIILVVIQLVSRIRFEMDHNLYRLFIRFLVGCFPKKKQASFPH
ncbi:hypothetical protein DERP_014565, partial [Dermatophagoides pteronyssinus]